MPREHFSFRLDKAIKTRLSDAAKSESRTASNLAELIISDWLNEHYPEEKTPDEKSPTRQPDQASQNTNTDCS